MYDVVMTHLEGARVDPEIAKTTAGILASRERTFGHTSRRSRRTCGRA
jgi:hypothetical protein